MVLSSHHTQYSYSLFSQFELIVIPVFSITNLTWSYHGTKLTRNYTCFDCWSRFAITARILDTGKSVYVAAGTAAGRAATAGAATGAFPRSALVTDPYIPEPEPTA